jgi:hypothetical protein
MHRASEKWLRRVTALTLALVLIHVPSAVRGQAGSDDALRRELDAVKEQLRRIEQQMKQQEEFIRKLTAPPPVAAPPAVATPPAQPAVIPDVEALKQQILADLQPQLAAANKTFASQFNPAISLGIDTVFSSSRKDKSNFEFRSAELGFSASIDPFARAYAFFNGTNDGVEVEEAALVTTSLPYNLTVKGGRFFADFGRLSTFHDHDLPFVNRPLVLDTYVGGESQADGVEVSWLVPIPHYLSVTVGGYNKIGAENDRASNDVPRDPGEFTYLGRIATAFTLTDEHTLDVGISDAFTPLVKSEGRNSRNLAGADLTYRYTPLSSAGYRGLVWGSEFLVNSENSETSAGTFRRHNSFGMYSYVEPKLSRRYYAGLLYEYVQDIPSPSQWTQKISPYFTIWASEFQRLRLQYTHTWSSNQSPDDAFFLQWTAFIGSHLHSFRDR